MFNFIEGHISIWYKLLYLLLYLIILIIGYNRIIRPSGIRKKNGLLMILFFSLFSVYYCLGSDYFQYQEWVVLKYNRDIWFKEQVYLYIIRFVRFISVDLAYDLFRLIVWGGALVLFYFSCKQDKKVSYFSLLFLFLFYFNVFSYARASLAMAIYFFGVTILASNKKLYKILGIFVICSSFLFHTEMIIAIAVSPLVLVSMEKKSFILYALLFSSIIIVALSFLGSMLSVLDEMVADENSLSEKAANINESISSGRWGAQSLGQYIGYLLFYIPFFSIIRIMLSSNSTKSFPMWIYYLYRVTFGIILISAGFAIIFGFGTIYYYRTLNICILPLSMLIAFMYNQKKLSQYYLKMLVVLAAFYQVSKLFLRVLET